MEHITWHSVPSIVGSEIISKTQGPQGHELWSIKG